MLGSTTSAPAAGGGLKKSRTKLWLILGAVVIVALAGLSGFLFWQYNQLKANPTAVAEEATDRLVRKVSTLYAVPTDEKPTVAQVQDKEKLKDQPFFGKAENSDYILIYTNAKLAILYREKDNKLINVGPINISEGDQSAVSGAEDKKEEEKKPETPAPATNQNRRP